MAASDWAVQFLADILAVPVDRQAGLETTEQRAAFAAGWRAGIYPGPESFADRGLLYRGWRDVVRRAL